MSELTNEQKKLLADMNFNPVWAELMRGIDEGNIVPRYKKGGDKQQLDDWVYQSGVVAGKEYVLKLLRYEK